MFQHLPSPESTDHVEAVNKQRGKSRGEKKYFYESVYYLEASRILQLSSQYNAGVREVALWG